MKPKERLFVALDDDGGPDFVPGKMEHPLVTQLQDEIGGFKIGSILFDMIGTLAGGDGVKTIGRPIMLDLKWHEPPDTMRRIADRMARNFDCEFCTIHARSGVETMRAFQDAAFKVAEGQAKQYQMPVSDWMTRILGVTVLTSETYDSLRKQGLVEMVFPAFEEFARREEDREVEKLVLRLALDAHTAGLDGVVCPSRFTTAVRKEFGPGFIIVNPGIRFAGSPADDHTNPMTPSQAIAAGADYIVMGRPITGAADPIAAAKRVVDEIAEASVKRA
ncbi:MAG: orotidine-5'-phosphate decarboxylase [Candidatus Sungbacteria bacterium]|nr:orotidine-5'-phosphate decarboxylase [Candidatus Sungbacteria bacterium]